MVDDAIEVTSSAIGEGLLLTSEAIKAARGLNGAGGVEKVERPSVVKDEVMLTVGAI